MTLEALGPALVGASLVAAIAAGRGLRPGVVAPIAAIAGALGLIPVAGVSGAELGLGIYGSLSAATLLLGLLLLLWSLGFGSRAAPSGAFLGCVIAAGVALYATVSGIMPFDLYDLGFRGPALPVLMAAFVVVGWLRGANDIPVWVGVAALLYLAGAYPSVNLWDHLIDPAGFVAAVVILAVRGVRRWRAQSPAKRENAETTRS